MADLSCELKKKLASVARSIVADGKGILAADESVPTVGKRFAGISLENVEENRRRFREMLFTCPGVEENLGGIIFFEETFYQKDSKGKSFVDLVKERGIRVGIKVDRGLISLPGGYENEQMTRGLDDLAERMRRFSAEGADFAKWRCVLKISNGTPTDVSVCNVATTLAMYARICQENGVVPIVEPEVLLDGDHDLERAQSVTEKVLARVYRELERFHVFLEGTLLKPNMVTAGQACSKKYSAEDVAKATVTTLSRTVPAAVAGVTFLSGGQAEMDATIHLDAINKFSGPKPWPLTFSFARALQNSCVEKWCGKDENLKEAHSTLLTRTHLNRQAAMGKYSPEMEKDESAKKSLFVAGHTY